MLEGLDTVFDLAPDVFKLSLGVGAAPDGQPRPAPLIDFRAILDPLSQTAQQLFPLLQLLTKAFPKPGACRIRLLLNPKENYDENNGELKSPVSSGA